MRRTADIKRFAGSPVAQRPTLPALLGAVFVAARWLSRKEGEVRSLLTGAQQELELIKGNHFHHIQETLDQLRVGQDRATEQMTAHTTAIVQANNVSKTPSSRPS
jgi:hypothetical protein